MGLDNKTAGFYSQVDNLPPSKEKIIQRKFEATQKLALSNSASRPQKPTFP